MTINKGDSYLSNSAQKCGRRTTVVTTSLLVLMLLSCRGQVRSPQTSPTEPRESGVPTADTNPSTGRFRPPDLSTCTRLDVQYSLSTLEHFFAKPVDKSVLSRAELEYVRSLESVPVDDPQIISALAHEVSKGHPIAPIEGPFSFKAFVRFNCYGGNGRTMAFTVMVDMIITDDGHWFKYDGGLRSAAFIPPQIRPLVLRARCARNLIYLYDRLRFRYWDGRALPSPPQWCDAIVEDQKEQGRFQESMMDYFTCPGARDGRSHYAINPNCKLDSPRDTVLLFEAKPGWNQRGGPELFTFDNHSPRGGLVLLNDADWDGLNEPTVRFIRTEEELKQLRWK